MPLLSRREILAGTAASAGALALPRAAAANALSEMIIVSPTGIAAAEGRAYVGTGPTSGPSRLLQIDVSNPWAPWVMQDVRLSPADRMGASSLVIRGNNLFAFLRHDFDSGRAYIARVDISHDTIIPRSWTDLPAAFRALGASPDGRFAYAVDFATGFCVVEFIGVGEALVRSMAPFEGPGLDGVRIDSFAAHYVDAIDGFALVAARFHSYAVGDYVNSILVVDMADPTKPVVVARADFPFDRDDPAITGVKTAWDTPHVFASTEGDWLYAIDVSDPYAPFVASRTQTLVGLPRILAAEKDFVAVMAWTQDSYGIVPFTHPSLLEPVRNLDVLEYGGIRQVGCSFGRYAYIGLSNSDIFRIVDLFPDA